MPGGGGGLNPGGGGGKLILAAVNGGQERVSKDDVSKSLARMSVHGP